jgi:putative ABC transport system permease protein
MLSFLFETFALGLKNLRLHKLRSLLTALGIIFGVSAVIIMVAIGAGAQDAARRQMTQLGANNIVIRSVRPPVSDEAASRAQRVQDYGLKRGDFARLQSLPHLTLAVPLKDTEQRVIRGTTRFNANAIGTHPDLFQVINLRPSRGRLLSVMDFNSAAPVVVLGATAGREMFPFSDPIGQTVQIGTSGMSSVLVTVVGVLEPTGLRAGVDSAGITNRDIDRDLYFPLTLARSTFGDQIVKREAGSREQRNVELSEVWLQTTDIARVEPLAAMAENLLGLPNRRQQDIDVKAPIEILRSAERLNRLFNFIMVGIASFSLVVGGIGIMNIMLATVTERTKEIGIRRALGAKRRHITLQFLIETTVISLSGGLLGIALGAGSALLLPVIVRLAGGADYPTAITSWSVIGSFVVSGLIGIGFGLYPAIQAARMNPIEALRHE